MLLTHHQPQHTLYCLTYSYHVCNESIQNLYLYIQIFRNLNIILFKNINKEIIRGNTFLDHKDNTLFLDVSQLFHYDRM